MQTRHQALNTAGKTHRHTPSEPAESTTRLRRAAPTAEDLRESVQASLARALDELDSLELAAADAVPPSLPQRMPRGMPPLPFKLALPSKMPPLPDAPAPMLEETRAEAPIAPSSRPEVAPNSIFFSSRVIALIALTGLLLLLAGLWQGR